MSSIPPELQPFRRLAWKPITQTGDGDRGISKFSGIPWLDAHTDWPICPNCNQPMQLFVQLNLQDLPTELGDRCGSGLLQLFYCTNDDMACDCDLEGWEPFSTAHVARLVQPQGDPIAPQALPTEPFPAQSITGWQAISDYPSRWEAQESLGVSLTESQAESLEAMNVPISGDKLAGWPFWVQGIEYPQCPICQQTMELVFQLDSEDNLPFMFGDAGCGHITQCPTHKDQLGFGWACC